MSVIANPYHKLCQFVLALIILFMTSATWAKVTLLDQYHQLKTEGNITLPGSQINLVSSEHDDFLSAEINSILHMPYEAVAVALSKASNWCQVLPLHFNIKACTYDTRENGVFLTIYSGRKIYEHPDDSYKMTYQFQITHQNDSQLSLQLHADHGPMSTSDYRILLEAMRVDEGTLLHIHSSYRPSWLSSMLTSTYLSTVGRNKIGFSRIEQNGKSLPVQGIKGIIERNVMRYHLAISAFLKTQSLPAAERHEATLTNWFEQNDSYPQLHEMDRTEYLEIKHEEWNNQQQLQQALNQPLHLTTTP